MADPQAKTPDELQSVVEDMIVKGHSDAEIQKFIQDYDAAAKSGESKSPRSWWKDHPITEKVARVGLGALPVAGTILGGIAGEAVAPAATPVSGIVGGGAGAGMGRGLADLIKVKTGMEPYRGAESEAAGIGIDALLGMGGQTIAKAKPIIRSLPTKAASAMIRQIPYVGKPIGGAIDLLESLGGKAAGEAVTPPTTPVEPSNIPGAMRTGTGAPGELMPTGGPMRAPMPQPPTPPNPMSVQTGTGSPGQLMMPKPGGIRVPVPTGAGPMTAGATSAAGAAGSAGPSTAVSALGDIEAKIATMSEAEIDSVAQTLADEMKADPAIIKRQLEFMKMMKAKGASTPSDVASEISSRVRNRSPQRD